MMLDIVRWMAVEMGFKPVFTDMTFQQAQEAVLSGKVDILTSLFYSDKRKEKFEFTGTIFEVPVSIFIRTERTDIKDLNDLNGKTIAIQKGDYARDFLESKKIRFNTLDTKDFAEATDMVIAGKADAVIGDEQIVLYHIFSNQLSAYIKKVGEPLYIGRNCMASNKDNAILTRILNKGIIEARKPGILDKISMKWLGAQFGHQESFLERHLWPLSAAAGGILLLSLWVWAWNVRLRTLVRKKTEVITRREEALRESKQQYDRLVSNIPDGVYLLRTTPVGEFSFEYVSPRMAEMLAISSESIVMDPKIAFEPIHPEELEAFSKLNRERIEARLPFLWEGRAIVTGTVKWLRIESHPEQLDNGDVLWHGIVADITERKQAEEALEQSRQNFYTFFNTIDDFLYVLSESGSIIHVNNTVIRRLGYSETELVGQSVLMVHPPELKEEAAQVVLAMLAGQISSCFIPVMTRDGRLIAVETRVTKGKWNGIPVLFGVSKNISQLKQSEEKFSRAFHSSSVSMAISTMDDGCFLDVNETFLTTMGFSREDVIGKTSIELGIFINLENRTETHRIVKETGRARNVEVQVRTKDGKILDGLFSADTITINDTSCLLTVMTDITDRKLMEEELLRAQKIESLGILAGGIAHDFNNLMTVVLGNVQLAMMGLPE
ncbi:MAG: PAS domain S-box protein, partial [Deltaproteobacteria bacterium]